VPSPTRSYHQRRSRRRRDSSPCTGRDTCILRTLGANGRGTQAARDRRRAPQWAKLTPGDSIPISKQPARNGTSAAAHGQSPNTCRQHPRRPREPPIQRAPAQRCTEFRTRTPSVPHEARVLCWHLPDRSTRSVTKGRFDHTGSYRCSKTANAEQTGFESSSWDWTKKCQRGWKMATGSRCLSLTRRLGTPRGKKTILK
jgi:hypothetical protein